MSKEDITLKITIEVTEEEKYAVVDAIRVLNRIEHLKYMSQAMIAAEAKIKATKVRYILMALIEEKRITQYTATDNKRLQRFYYTVHDNS